MSRGSREDLLDDIQFRAESGNRHRDSKGNLITSPVGAAGISQVMPKTGVDPGYGVTPLKDQSEAEYRRFGREYRNAMLREFGGDLPKALAAYNYGPGAVQKLVAKHGDNWLAKAPEETRNYVAKITQEFGSEVPSAQAPTRVVARPAAPAEGAPTLTARAPVSAPGTGGPTAVPLPPELLSYLANRGKPQLEPSATSRDAWQIFLASMSAPKGSDAVAPSQPQAQPHWFDGQLAAARPVAYQSPPTTTRVDFTPFASFGSWGNRRTAA